MIESGIFVSSLSTMTIRIDLSERIAVKVAVPLHTFELDDTGFMDRLMLALRSMNLPMTNELRSFNDILNHVVKQVKSAIIGMANLPVMRKITVTVEQAQPACSVERIINIRRDGLPEGLLRENQTRESLMMDWSKFRERVIGEIL